MRLVGLRVWAGRARTTCINGPLLAHVLNAAFCIFSLHQEMGFDKLDLRSFKLNGVAGVDLLDMSEDEMVVRLLLPRHKVGRRSC